MCSLFFAAAQYKTKLDPRRKDSLFKALETERKWSVQCSALRAPTSSMAACWFAYYAGESTPAKRATESQVQAPVELRKAVSREMEEESELCWGRTVP